MGGVNRGWIAALAVLSLVSACGTPDPEDERPVPPAPTLPSGALSTDATTSTEAPDTTAVVEQSTTDFVTTTEPPTTTAPSTTVLDDLVVLRPDGLGRATFGQDADTAIADLTASLGAPNADSGWVPAVSSPFGVCPGNEVRGLRWGPLQVLFGDQGTGARRLFTWVYAVALLPAEETQSLASGLQTVEGIGLGSSIADLALVYPELDVSSDVFGPTYSTSALAGYSGTISSDGADGFVTSIVGGTYCGE